MRFALRLILGASLLALTLLLVIKAFLQDIWDQYSVHSYIGSSLEDTFGKHDSSNYVPLVSDADQDKTIVMARMEKDNVDWVTNELPEYAPDNDLLAKSILIESLVGRVPYIRSILPPPFPLRMIPPPSRLQQTKARNQWPTLPT